MRVLVSGGGTAGHINPAIAIAKYIQKKEPDSEILFVGRQEGMEQKLVSREGFSMEYIEIEGLKRKLTAENLRVLKLLLSARKKCRRIIRDFKPDLVVGTGGYVCTPLVQEANRMKIKTLIHEQNVVPGVAIKMLAKDSTVTAISFSETKEYLPKEAHTVLTGNPLRDSVLFADGEQNHRELSPDGQPCVLMFGGSLGAERMNDALVDMLKQPVRGYQLFAATGEKHYDGIMKRLEEQGIPSENKQNVHIMPYIYDMDRYFSAADLVVSRAGAITIGEITALGKAAILVPSPYVAHNHQELNARVLEKRGAAKVLLESELSGEHLRTAIADLIGKPELLASMRRSSKEIGISDACEKIYQSVR